MYTHTMATRNRFPIPRTLRVNDIGSKLSAFLVPYAPASPRVEGDNTSSTPSEFQQTAPSGGAHVHDDEVVASRMTWPPHGANGSPTLKGKFLLGKKVWDVSEIWS